MASRNPPPYYDETMLLTLEQAFSSQLAQLSARLLFLGQRAESQDGVAMIPSAIAMRHRYQELTMPVVIMASIKDGVVNAKQSRRFHAQIPHSTLRLVPGIGHMLHYAVPEEVAQAIEEAGGLATMLDNTRHAS